MLIFFAEHWTFIFTAFISLVSIFISNYLGRKSNFIEYKMDMEKERYINFYLPIIKHLYSIDSEHVTLNVMTFNTLTGETNFLANHIQKNFEYISPQVGSLYTEYQPLSGRVLFNDEFETVEELDILFKKIIQQVLKDSSKLSRKLELPDLAQPLSDAFF